MVSPELIRRFPFFSGLTIEQITKLAKAGDEVSVERDHYFHREGEELDKMYMIEEGEVQVVTSMPQRDREIVLNTLGTGDLFGWSALVPPFVATASAKSVTPCKFIAFDAKELLDEFESDAHFGFVMMRKIAQLVRDRLNAIRIETLAYLIE
jgi:CRP-like cAMP-binding protein